MNLSWINFLLLLFLIKFSSCVLKLHVVDVGDKGKRSTSEYVYVEAITTTVSLEWAEVLVDLWHPRVEQIQTAVFELMHGFS